LRVILLHGWTMRGDVFAPLIAALPGVECMAPDLPGHGAEGYAPTIAGGADMLADLLSTGPAVALGWSMGALVVWDSVARHGTTNLRGLITVDMSPRPLPDWPLGLSGQTADDARARSDAFRADWAGAAQAMAAAMFATREGAPGLSRAQAAARIAAQDPAVMAPFWDQMLAADHRATIANLPMPCLAIHGARSRVYPPACADWIAANAPSGRAAILSDSGHAPILEQPGATATAIRTFLDTLP
jgi:pimeloyl-[acyl-carrier protein] methyl ester esterase